MKFTYLDCLALFGVGGAHPGGLQLTKDILSKEEMDQTKSILDAGCGTGQTSAYIAKHYQCNVTALDNHNVILDKAKQRFLSMGLPIKVQKGSIENLPFEEASFDIILAESVIAFTDVPLTVSEFKRVLKPGGVLLAIEVVLEKSLSDEELESVSKFYGFSQILTESDWCNLFQRASFKQINIEKAQQQVDQHDVENAADFSPSENIDGKLIEILEKHEQLTEEYKDILSYRIFRCCA